MPTRFLVVLNNVCERFSREPAYKYLVCKLYTTQKNSGIPRGIPLFLVRSTGIAPLAARPAKRLLIVCFAFKQEVFVISQGKTLTPVRGSTLNPCRKNETNKNRMPFGHPIFVVRSTGIEPAWSYPQDP